MIYDAGATVFLENINTNIEIQGNLLLTDNANFTFNYSGNTNGYVKFSSPLSLPINISAGINCSMTFTGHNTLIKVLEVDQEGLYPPSNLTSFNVQNGTVRLHAHDRILPLGWQTLVNFDLVRLTSDLPGTYNGHLGLQMVGQPHSLTRSIFEYGEYGIHYVGTLGHNDFYASDCTFRRCKQGLFTDDRGVHLTRCYFYNNTIIGWNTGVMSNPSDADQGVVGGSSGGANQQGYYYYANNAAPLTLTDPNITYNNTSGVQVERTLMQASCGTISNNVNKGIVLGKAATLQMDNGSNVTCVGNAFTIALAHANYLFLYKGNNDLTPLVPLSHTAVAGTLISSGPYPILADKNKWSSGGFGPLDYSILYNGVNQLMTDWNPQTSIDACGQAIPPPPPQPRGPEDPLAHCDECDIINTEDFENERLNVAVGEAIDRARDNSENNYVEAVNLFSQILMEDYFNPSNKEKYLLSLNYLKMLDALGNAFGSGQLTWQQDTSVIDATTQKVIGVLNKLIDLAVSSNNYDGRLIYSLDKAAVYRLADRRDLALGVLYSISNWIGQDDVDELTRLECIYDLENQALLGSIPAQELFSAINSCGGSQEERRSNPIISTTAPQSDEMQITTYPSPATSEITLVTNVEHGEEVLMNSVGQQVYGGTFSNEDVIDVSNLPKGIYSLEITDKDRGKKKIQRIVIQ